MSNTITGQEFAYVSEHSYGESIYGKTLRDFMCALIKNELLVDYFRGNNGLPVPESVSGFAHDLTVAYLKQLNEFNT